MPPKKYLTKWSKSIFAYVVKKLVDIILVSLLVATGVLSFLTKTLLSFPIGILNIQVPLWITIGVVVLILLLLRIYLSYHASEQKIALKTPMAEEILVSFGHKSDETLTTKELSLEFNLSFQKTQAAIDELVDVGFLDISLDQPPWRRPNILAFARGQKILIKEELIIKF